MAESRANVDLRQNDRDAFYSGAGALQGAPPSLGSAGGMSLAVYMHGVTKELHELVQAAAAFETDQSRRPASAQTAQTPLCVTPSRKASSAPRRHLVSRSSCPVSPCRAGLV